MPCDYKNYPPDWKTVIRPRILARAKNRCEWCGVANGQRGFRDRDGEFITANEYAEGKGNFGENAEFVTTLKIVLTIAHIDQDVTNNDPGNLVALCQRCHLRHDRFQHAANARKKRDKRTGQLNIFLEAP